MNKGKTILLGLLGAGIIADGTRRIVRHVQNKPKKVKETRINKKLAKTCEAFRKECMKSEDNGLQALYMMDKLKDEIDAMGVDPRTINTKIEETISQGAGA